MKLLIWAIGALVLLGAGGGYWYWHEHNTQPVTFRLSELVRGDMVPTISATGTIEPQDVIDVGAQVAGQILSFGADTNGKTVDYTSPVDEKTILANIDPTTYDAGLGTAEAQLSQAKAGVTSAIAARDQMQAKLDQAKSDWDRAQKLQKGEALSESDYNNYQAAYKTAVANLAAAIAAIEQAKAAVLLADAQVVIARRNVEYCTIRSPVKGVVIDRRVNVGQTVVASLNTPSLFLIAKDLTQVSVWVSVNEADIGRVYQNQPVSFTVDAHPGQIFRGSVGKIRLNATMTQNVVTYTVEVVTDNADSKLLPYMTANVQFEITRHKDVLLAPNAALRWYPQMEQVTPSITKDALAKMKKGDAEDQPVESRPRKGRPTSRPTTRPLNSEPHGKGIVWVQDGKYVRPVKVKTGYTDGLFTEIHFKEEELPLGTQLVTGEQHAQATDAGTTNPFAPQPFRPGGGGGGGGGGRGR